MCGRYSLSADPTALALRFGLAERPDLRPRYNVAPGDPILTFSTNREGGARAEHVRWGLVPAFAREPGRSGQMINARTETAAEKPAFRTALARGRCLIPADGFYEWRAGVAHHITRSDAQPFAFAGLRAVWHRGAPEEVRSAAILTTAANAAIAPLHGRMPVILAPDGEQVWLDSESSPDQLQAVLGGLDAAHTAIRALGRAVNDARHDAPDCLDDAPDCRDGASAGPAASRSGSAAPAQIALF